MADKETAITELQQWLRNINKSKNDGPAIIPDGLFSAETRLAVEAFQLEKGLPVTGVADYFTWEAIKKESRSPLNLQLYNSVDNSHIPFPGIHISTHILEFVRLFPGFIA